AKFKLLSLTLTTVRQQRQLVQPLSKLRGRLRHCRTRCGPSRGLAPIKDGFFNEPCFGVMVREELGLAVHQLGKISLRCLGNQSMQLLPGTAQKTTVGCFLDQRMLEGIDRIRRCAALKYQLGSDKPGERGSELVLRQT